MRLVAFERLHQVGNILRLTLAVILDLCAEQRRGEIGIDDAGTERSHFEVAGANARTHGGEGGFSGFSARRGFLLVGEVGRLAVLLGFLQLGKALAVEALFGSIIAQLAHGVAQLLSRQMVVAVRAGGRHLAWGFGRDRGCCGHLALGLPTGWYLTASGRVRACHLVYLVCFTIAMVENGSHNGLLVGKRRQCCYFPFRCFFLRSSGWKSASSRSASAICSGVMCRHASVSASSSAWESVLSSGTSPCGLSSGLFIKRYPLCSQVGAQHPHTDRAVTEIECAAKLNAPLFPELRAARQMHKLLDRTGVTESSGDISIGETAHRHVFPRHIGVVAEPCPGVIAVLAPIEDLSILTMLIASAAA